MYQELVFKDRNKMNNYKRSMIENGYDIISEKRGEYFILTNETNVINVNYREVQR